MDGALGDEKDWSVNVDRAMDILEDASMHARSIRDGYVYQQSIMSKISEAGLPSLFISHLSSI